MSPKKMYYGKTDKIEVISRTLKERALRKYHESIDVSKHEEGSIKKNQEI